MMIETPDIVRELQWLEEILYERICHDGKNTVSVNRKDPFNIKTISPPQIKEPGSGFSSFIIENNLSFEERALLILAIAPHLKPELLEEYAVDEANLLLFEVHSHIKYILGTRGLVYKGLLPTGLTYLYLMAGKDSVKRLEIYQLLSCDLNAQLQDAIFVEPHQLGEPSFSGRLGIKESYLETFFNSIDHNKSGIKYKLVNQ